MGLRWWVLKLVNIVAWALACQYSVHPSFLISSSFFELNSVPARCIILLFCCSLYSKMYSQLYSWSGLREVVTHTNWFHLSQSVLTGSQLASYCCYAVDRKSPDPVNKNLYNQRRRTASLHSKQYTEQMHEAKCDESFQSRNSLFQSRHF